MRNKLVYHDLDGKPRVQREVFFMKGMTTGECPECHQMPCQHTAKLMGWVPGTPIEHEEDRAHGSVAS